MEFKITTPYGTAVHHTTSISPGEKNVIHHLMIPKGLRDETFETLETELLQLQKFKKISVGQPCPHGKALFNPVISTEEIDGDLLLAAEILSLLPQATVSSVLFKSHTMTGYCNYCKKQHKLTTYSVRVRVTQNNFPVQRVYSYGTPT